MDTTESSAPRNLRNLDKPTGLGPRGEAAYDAIVAFLRRRKMTYTGGCKTFYSPAEWKARGEKYGLESALIVVYAGGEVRRAFCADEEDYKCIDAMHAALEKVGLYAEECTGWYCAIYTRTQ